MKKLLLLVFCLITGNLFSMNKLEQTIPYHRDYITKMALFSALKDMPERYGGLNLLAHYFTGNIKLEHFNHNGLRSAGIYVTRKKNIEKSNNITKDYLFPSSGASKKETVIINEKLIKDMLNDKPTLEKLLETTIPLTTEKPINWFTTIAALKNIPKKSAVIYALTHLSWLQSNILAEDRNCIVMDEIYHCHKSALENAGIIYSNNDEEFCGGSYNWKLENCICIDQKNLEEILSNKELIKEILDYKPTKEKKY